MFRRKRVRAHALFASFLLALASQQVAAQATPSQGQPVVITDAAGRVHKIMPMNSITPAQRKAAAERAAMLRGTAGQHQPPAANGKAPK